MLFPPTNWTFGCLMLLLLNVFLQGVRNCLDFYPNSPTMSNPFIPYGGFTVMVFPCFSRFIFPRSSRLWPNHHHWGFPNPNHPRPSQRSKKPSGRVAMESKKHAARRPRPPLPSAGSASSAKRSCDTWGKPQKGLNHGEKPWGDHGKRFEKPPEMGISDDFIMNLMV